MTSAQPLPFDAPGTRAVRVLVVDADRRVRSSLNGLISLADGFRMVRAVSNAADAMTVLSAEPVDVVLIDPRLPDLDVGLAFLVEVHRMWPSVALVAMHGSDLVAPTSMQNGAVAFVAKSGQPEVILSTLARAAGVPAVRARPHDDD
jgi:DNA-binding NtrC family response regulator